MYYRLTRFSLHRRHRWGSALLTAAVAVALPAALAPAPAAFATARPDLVISAVTSSTKTVTAGKSLTLTGITRNTGSRSAASNYTRFYLSTDKTRSSTDTVLGSAKLPRLAAGAKGTGKKLLTIPAKTPARGYWLIVCADATRLVAESREGNNCRVGPALTVRRPSPPTPPPPPPVTNPDAGPTQSQRDALLAAAGPMNLFHSPPATSTHTANSTFEQAHAVTQTIGPDGGQLQLIDDAGDQITVDFPAHALLAPTELTAVPVADIDGAAQAGVRPIGVKLEPSGLGLMQRATMSVVPADGITDRKAEGMISASDGTDVNPEMVLPDTGKLAMPVNHFTVVSVLVPDGSGGTTTRYFTQSEYTATLRNALVQAIEDARDTGVDTGRLVDVNATIVAASDAYWNDVVVPLINQSATSCTFARANMSTVMAAAHNDEILGIDRPAAATGLAAALRNCWKEATATCMTMSPSRYSALVALAREMSVLGITTSAGDAADPLSVSWCGNINGYLKITREQDTDIAPPGGNSSTEREVTHATVWVTVPGFYWWTPDGSFGVAGNQGNPTYSTVDVTGDWSDNETWQTFNGPCSYTGSAHPVIHQAPIGTSMWQLFSATTMTGTSTGGLTISGWPVPIPALDETVAGADCNGNPLAGHYYPWWAPINDPYTLTVDPAKGDVNAAWDHTTSDGDGYIHTEHVTIDANLHVDGLRGFLAAGHH